MADLNADQLLAAVTDSYFGNVDLKRLEPALACFATDATLTVQTERSVKMPKVKSSLDICPHR